MTDILAEGSRPTTSRTQEQVRLLVVDDDALGRSMMDIMLSPHGYKLDFACDGAEAVQAIQSRQYDLVFMDLVLPDMNGRDVCREVRRWEAGKRHVPIIAVTAYDLPGQPVELIKAGMDDYIFKPYDLRGLTRVIRLYAQSGQEPSGVDGAEASPRSDEPVLDIEGSLLDFANDVDGYRDLLRDFLASLPSRLEKMRQAHAAGDMDRLGRECHSLKGISAGLGAMQLSRLSTHLSNAVSGGKAEAIPGLLGHIEAGIAELQGKARAYLAS